MFDIISVFVAEKLKYTADVFGTTEAALKLLLSVIFCYPLSFFYRYVIFGKNPNIQHIYFAATGFLLGYCNFGGGVFHNLICVLLQYTAFLLLGPTATCIAVTFLNTGYWYTESHEYDIIWTMPHCVLTLRMIALSFNYYDGRHYIHKPSDQQKNESFQQLPSLTEILGYTFFPCTYLIGPYLSLCRYQNLINGNLLKEENKERNINSLPSCISYGMNRGILGLLVLIIYVFGTTFAPISFLNSPSYLELNFIYKFFCIGLYMQLVTCKYISAWLLAEGSCVLTSISFNGFNANNEPVWDGACNVKIKQYLAATQLKHLIACFNINTNQWSANYIYKRLSFLGNRTISLLCTLSFLAVWHGFHSGYFVTFMLELFGIKMEREISIVLDKLLLSKFFSMKSVQCVIKPLQKLYVMCMLGYCLIPFVLLSWRKYFIVLKSVYFIGHIILLGWPVVNFAFSYVIQKEKKS